MKATLQSPLLLNDINLQSALNLFEQKKSAYADVICTDGEKWKKSGLPVDLNLIYAMKSWLFHLPLTLLTKVNDNGIGMDMNCENDIETVSVLQPLIGDRFLND